MQKKNLLIVLLIWCNFALQAQVVMPCPEELIPKYDKDKRAWGYSDLFGIMILEPIYTKVSPFRENRAVVQKGNLSGVINCDGMVILPLQYEKLTDFRNGRIWAQKGGLWGLLDDKGRAVIAHQYEDIYPIMNTELAWVSKDKKWGLVDEVKGKVLCPLQYDMVQIISVNASLVKSGEYYGVTNHVNCNYLLPLNLEHVKRLTQHELLFEQNKKWGIFNIGGKMISEPQYDSIGLSLPNLFVVKKKDNYGLVDQQGLARLPIEYSSIGPFSYGYAAVEQKGLFGYTTRFGKVYIPVMYEAAQPFVLTHAAVKKDGKWGIIDIRNQTVVPFEYDAIGVNAKNTLWVLTKGAQSRLLPVSSKQAVLSPWYDKVFPEDSTALVRVVSGGKYYFYDSVNGRLAFEASFDVADPLYEGYAVVKQDGNFGVVNAEGVMVVPAEYSEIQPIGTSQQKEWLVKKQGLWGLRSSTKVLWPGTFEWVYAAGNGLFKVKQNGKYGAVNHSMQPLGEIVYDGISVLEPQWPSVVTKSKKQGLLSNNGQLITPARYDSLLYCGAGYFKGFSGKTLSLVKPSGEAIKTKWKDVGYWNESLLAFNSKDKWGFATSSMEESIPAQFDAVGFFYQALAPVIANGKAGVITKSGKWIISPEYDGFLQTPETPQVVLLKDGKQYRVDARGKVLLVD